MTSKHNELHRVFHEPSRLAILSELAGSDKGKTFVELKGELALTDGNLSRHLKVLEEAKVIGSTKEFVENKPQTTLFLTKGGREEFLEYLQALESVLITASKRASLRNSNRNPKGSGKLMGLKRSPVGSRG